MDRIEEEAIVEVLARTNEDFRREREAHRYYERILEELLRRTRLTSDEEIEKRKIQKLKLAGKDRMARMIADYRKQNSGFRNEMTSKGDGKS